MAGLTSIVLGLVRGLCGCGLCGGSWVGHEGQLSRRMVAGRLTISRRVKSVGVFLHGCSSVLECSPRFPSAGRVQSVAPLIEDQSRLILSAVFVSQPPQRTTWLSSTISAYLRRYLGRIRSRLLRSRRLVLSAHVFTSVSLLIHRFPRCPFHQTRRA